MRLTRHALAFALLSLFALSCDVNDGSTSTGFTAGSIAPRLRMASGDPVIEVERIVFKVLDAEVRTRTLLEDTAEWTEGSISLKGIPLGRNVVVEALGFTGDILVWSGTSAPMSASRSPESPRSLGGVVELATRFKPVKPVLTLAVPRQFYDGVELEFGAIDAQAGEEIRYTLDGTLPTESSDLYDPEQKPWLQATTVIARIYRLHVPGDTALFRFEKIVVPVPVVKTTQRQFSDTMIVELETKGAGGAKILFTMQDLASDPPWFEYPQTGILIDRTSTIHAKACVGGACGEDVQETFIKVAPETILSPVPSTIDSVLRQGMPIGLAYPGADPGGAIDIHYTLDGRDPLDAMSGRVLYTGPISTSTWSAGSRVTLRARAFRRDDMTKYSESGSWSYKVVSGTAMGIVTILPAQTPLMVGDSVWFNYDGDRTGVDLYYTTDGSEPKAGNPAQQWTDGGFVVTAAMAGKMLPLRVVAFRDSFRESSRMAAADYPVAAPPPPDTLPVVHGILPDSGVPGRSVVRIAGARFGDDATAIRVLFGAYPGMVLAADSTWIDALVPAEFKDPTTNLRVEVGTKTSSPRTFRPAGLATVPRGGQWPLAGSLVIGPTDLAFDAAGQRVLAAAGKSGLYALGLSGSVWSPLAVLPGAALGVVPTEARAVVVDENGRIFAGTDRGVFGIHAAGGLYELNAVGWPKDASGELAAVNDLVLVGEELYAATTVGVYAFDEVAGEWIPEDQNWPRAGSQGLAAASLAVGSDGIYAATHSGILRFDSADGIWIPAGFPQPTSKVFFDPARGEMYAGTTQASVWRLSQGAWQSVGDLMTTEAIAEKSVLDLVLSGQDLYAATPFGAFRIRPDAPGTGWQRAGNVWDASSLLLRPDGFLDIGMDGGGMRTLFIDRPPTL